MKTTRMSCALICIMVTTAWSQETPKAAFEVSLPAIDISSIRFTPPEPKAPAALPKALSGVEHDCQTHSVTIMRCVPSEAPDIIKPKRSFEQKAAVRLSDPDPDRITHHLLLLSVTVYDNEVSFIRWVDPHTSESFEAWCQWDWTLLQSVKEMKQGKRRYSFIYSPGHSSSEAITDRRSKRIFNRVRGLEPLSFRITEGDRESPFAKPFLQAMKRVIKNQGDELTLISAAFAQRAKDKAAWEKANPRRPQDQTIWIRPHRGSRYLKEEGGAE